MDEEQALTAAGEAFISSIFDDLSGDMNENQAAKFKVAWAQIEANIKLVFGDKKPGKIR